MPERMYSSPGSKCHLQLISALNLCSRVTMADSKQFDALAGRLRKMSLTDADSPEALEAVMKMTLSELSQCPIDFGKTHLGKKFKDMVGETKYLTWFAETYKHSKKLSHVRFLRFIQLHLDQIDEQMNHAAPKSAAKAKGAPKSMNRPPVPEMPLDPWHHPSSEEEEMVEAPWESVNPNSVNDEEVAMMRNRMGEMESVLQQILSHLNSSSAGSQN